MKFLTISRRVFLVDIVRTSYKFETGGRYETKTATLSDADSVWTDVRHLHMSEAIDKLKNDFSTFMRENAGFKGCVL